MKLVNGQAMGLLDHHCIIAASLLWGVAALLQNHDYITITSLRILKESGLGLKVVSKSVFSAFAKGIAV